jgi:hypothetical protein
MFIDINKDKNYRTEKRYYLIIIIKFIINFYING